MVACVLILVQMYHLLENELQLFAGGCSGAAVFVPISERVLQDVAGSPTSGFPGKISFIGF